MKIRDKELYLSKFWRHLVNIKNVKIWHLNSHISYINQNKKIYFFVKINTMILLIMYQTFSSLLSHLPFSVLFLLHFYGVTFFGTPNIKIRATFVCKHILIRHSFVGGLYICSIFYLFTSNWFTNATAATLMLYPPRRRRERHCFEKAVLRSLPARQGSGVQSQKSR